MGWYSGNISDKYLLMYCKQYMVTDVPELLDTLDEALGETLTEVLGCTVVEAVGVTLVGPVLIKREWIC